MARIKQECAEKGSQKWLQLAVNDYSELFNTLVAQQLHPKPSSIEWVSPLRCDDYAEYRDGDFIDRLGLELKNCPLNTFWPARGPWWDGLAKTDKDQVLLVEAKAYIGEMKGKGSNATSCKSRDMIACILAKTQTFLCAKQSCDWAKSPYYQYANRLAHLFLLAELNGIDAYLLNIYFLNDARKKGPNSSDFWEGAIHKQYEEMGLLQDHALADRIVNLYMDVRKLDRRGTNM